MKNCSGDKPFKILLSPQLNIPGLNLLGYAKFLKTFDALDNHCHPGMEFIAVLKGTQQYVVDEKIYTLRGGDVFMTHPNEIHGNDNSPQEVAEIVWFQLDYDSPEAFLGLMSPFKEYVTEQLKNYNKRIIHAEQKDLLKLRSAYEQLAGSNVKEHLQGYNHFLEFVIKYLCTNKENDPKAVTDDMKRMIETSKAYISSHISENINIEELAKHCGMSFSGFNTRFKEQFGITPHAYILKCKIELAKKLLMDPQNTVTNVAFQLNFSSGDYFSTVFKKYTGITPSQYRINCILP